MKDALGQDIVFGRSYGYTIEINGITTVRIGTAESVTPKGYITMLIKRSTTQYSVNGERHDNTDIDGIGKTSVKPIKLFPL